MNNELLKSDIAEICGAFNFSCFKNKTVLITGAGQLPGYYLACAFLINNDKYFAGTKIIAVDSDEKIFELYAKLTSREDIEFVVSSDYSYLGAETVDFIIHTQPFSTLSFIPALTNLMKFAEKTGAVTVLNVYDDVYGDVFNGSDKITESDLGYIDIASSADFNKQSQRMALSLAMKLFADKGLDIRLSVSCLIYGAMGFGEGKKYTDLFSNAVQKHNLIVDQSDNMPSSCIYVTDFAVALLTVLTKGKPGELYNIASGFTTTTPEIAEACVGVFKNTFKVVFKGKERPLSPISPNLKILDAEKLNALGFKARVGVRDGVRRSTEIVRELRGGE